MGQVSFLPGRVAAMEGGKAIIALDGGGKISVVGSGGYASGEAVDVAVRPENVRIARAGAPSAEALSGTVAEHTYLGNANEYVVAVGETRLRVQTHPMQVLALGDAVTIEFDAEQCCVFGRAAG